MASSCKRRICSNEKRGFRQDLVSWRSKLIDCVGKIYAVCLMTRFVALCLCMSEFKVICRNVDNASDAKSRQQHCCS